VPFKKYLMDLTSRRAAKLFVLTFVLGAVCIALNFGLPWTPGILVAAYGSILLYAEAVCFVSHAEMTNNSPYFLGFIFFLFSLLVTFSRFSIQVADSQIDYVIRELGSALFATIVGLPFRQLLFAYSTHQADQDLFFRTLEEELRRSATEFRKSQAELVQLVQEFAEMRQGLFSDEEKAARKYVDNLQKASALFDDALSHYPTVISAALLNCTRSLQMMMQNLQDLAAVCERANPTKISEMMAQFEGLKTSSVSLTAELTSLKGAALELRTLAAEIPTDAREQFLLAKNDLDQVRAGLRERISSVQGEITSIDKVLSDFVALTQDRLEAMR
jgi:hypothetical protein